MSAKVQIGGSASINGIVMINIAKGKVARAVRSFDGTVSVKNMLFAEKALQLYKARIERLFSKIPVFRELLRIMLMLVIAISSIIAGSTELFDFRKRWTVKRVISVAVIVTGLSVLLVSDSYPALISLAVLIIFFHKGIAEILKYHGAEHKCINMYESEIEPSTFNADTAQKFPRIHTRCGTNIIFVLVPLSIIYYIAAEKQFFLQLATGGAVDLICSILLLGIAVELFRIFQNSVLQFLLKPGMFLQRFLTTKEPENRHLEVAIKALEAVL
jgi:uncharacterized protein YqhQ